MGDPNAMDARGVTAIALAAGRGDAGGVMDLLREHADPNPPWTAGHPRRTEFEARRETERYGFRIPLFAAVESGNADCVELLLHGGAHVLDASDRTALFYAVTEEIARILVEAGLKLDHRDQYGWSALDAAVSDGSLERARTLLSVGADPNAVHDRGYTVFMSAVSSMDRKIEMLDLLLKHGADPRAVSEPGYTALHAAIDVNGEANSEESVRVILGYLVGLGLDVEATTKEGVTPLARALECGTEIETRVLLELGANANGSFPECADGRACRHAHGAPLLFGAVTDPLKLEALLKAGADPSVTREDGTTAIGYARKLLVDAETSPPKDPEWAKEWTRRLKASVALLETPFNRTTA